MTTPQLLTNERHTMPAESASGLAALLKLYGLKAVLGMIGAALLYLALPPRNPDGTFNNTEFVARLACAGVFSCLFGDAAYALLLQSDVTQTVAQALGPKAVDLLVGAPAWWITRAIALWLQQRSDKNIVEMIKDVKDMR